MLRTLPLLALILTVPARGASPGTDGFECFLRPAAEVEVGSPLDGVLSGVEVDRGDRVTEGQVVARLRTGVEEASVELARLRAASEASVRSAQARSELAAREYERRLELSGKSYASATEVEIARTEMVLAELALEEAREDRAVAEVELRRARALLERRIVRSPFDGVVVERLVGPGALVEREPILRLARTDPVHVEVVLPAEHLGRVAPGDPADVFPEFPRGQRFRATVQLVDRIVDPASGTFGVRLALPNPDGRITPGLQCRVAFPYGPSA